MTIKIIVPHMGETTTEVKILRWLKAVGDHVAKGEPLFEVETDKATIEIESFGEGTLQRILVPEGDIADAMQVVAIIGEGELDEATLEKADAPKVTTKDTPMQASPVAKRVADELGVDIGQVTGTGKGGRITADDVRRYHTERSAIPSPLVEPAPQILGAASPKARRLAKETGLDLSRLAGSGPDGLITADDVQHAVEATSRSVNVAPFSKQRKAIANLMSQSKGTIPHFYLFMDVEMLACQKFRDHCLHALGWEHAPTYTDLIVKASALALADMPEINIRYSDEGLISRESVDLGIAVGVDEGLIVPVLQSVDKLELKELSEAVQAMTQRAREGKLKGSDLSEKSMVVSNLGMEGLDAFIAIIDPSDTMILAVGKVADRVVPIEGKPAIRPMCTLVLSIDHRVLDGVIGSRFLRMIKDTLEDPFTLLRKDLV